MNQIVTVKKRGVPQCGTPLSLLFGSIIFRVDGNFPPTLF